MSTSIHKSAASAGTAAGSEATTETLESRFWSAAVIAAFFFYYLLSSGYDRRNRVDTRA